MRGEGAGRAGQREVGVAGSCWGQPATKGNGGGAMEGQDCGVG